MSYIIKVLPFAIKDIQEAIDYYETQQTGLGKKFELSINKCFNALHKNPFYQIRYNQVHCFPIAKFPFMVHFTIDETSTVVYIRAILHTKISPHKNGYN